MLSINIGDKQITPNGINYSISVPVTVTDDSGKVIHSGTASNTFYGESEPQYVIDDIARQIKRIAAKAEQLYAAQSKFVGIETKSRDSLQDAGCKLEIVGMEVKI